MKNGKNVEPLKVAIITHDFSGFTGSEIVALEVANHYAHRGHHVIVRAERTSEALNAYLHNKVTVAPCRLDIADFDMVWSQQGHFCLNTSNLRRLAEWHGKFISVHLSGITPAATYYHPFGLYAVSCGTQQSHFGAAIANG